MTLRNCLTATLGRFLAVIACLMFLAGCGGGSSSSTPPTTPASSNTTTMEVNPGPANSVNIGFVDVTVCTPGSTTNCATITNVQVDTGSEGLRVLSSAVASLTTPLPTITDSSGDVLQECVQFGDLSYVWGPVAQADVTLAGEKASSLPIQIISASPTYPVPSSCLSGGSGPSDNTVATLGANGLIGIGVFPQDCGGDCTETSGSPVPQYFFCPGGTCTAQAVTTSNQLWNPVAAFSSSDNNGVLISLPSISSSSGGQASVSGSLIFGIGTQSDNALGTATVYATDDYGNIQTTYNSVAYPSFFDTGSNGYFVLDATTLGVTECASPEAGWYCPSSTTNVKVGNLGYNSVSGSFTISIANADNLFSSGFAAFNNLAGPSGTYAVTNTEYVDYGMSFFFGHNVFVGIVGQALPTGVSASAVPYTFFAY